MVVIKDLVERFWWSSRSSKEMMTTIKDVFFFLFFSFLIWQRGVDGHQEYDAPDATTEKLPKHQHFILHHVLKPEEGDQEFW